jgi:hypothetical protein
MATRHGRGIYLFSKVSTPAVEPGGYRVLSTEGTRQEHEADHSPPSSAEVKNEWRYIWAPPYVFMPFIRTNSPFLIIAGC